MTLEFEFEFKTRTSFNLYILNSYILKSNISYPGPPWYQFNGHLQTILPAFGGPSVEYRRERIELADSDFLDLDWLQAKKKAPLAILTHGLEGSSTRPYIRSAARYFHEQGWDVLAWNCRSCSGEMNRLLRLYHHGEIGDLGLVVDHAIAQYGYDKIVLLGYSMGGAMSAKYLGVHGDNIPQEVLGGIAFSSPFDLAASVDALELSGNGVYKRRFLQQLGDKCTIKAERFPGVIDISKLKHVKQWRDFDEWFTAPMLGLPSAQAFYDIASANNFLPGLKRPFLAVTAINDPIITPECLPSAEVQALPHFTFETTNQGGHVGYRIKGQRAYNWMDVRAWAQMEMWMKITN